MTHQFNRNRNENRCNLPQGTLSEIFKNEDKLEQLSRVLEEATRDTSQHAMRRILNHVKKDWKTISEEDLPLLKNKLVLIIEYNGRRGVIKPNLKNCLIRIVKDMVKTKEDAELFRDYVIEMPVAYAKSK